MIPSTPQVKAFQRLSATANVMLNTNDVELATVLRHQEWLSPSKAVVDEAEQ
jgi:hypothetical protein